MGNIYRLSASIIAAGALSLTACNKPDKTTQKFDDTAYFADLKNEVFILKDAEELKVDDIISALPDYISVTYNTAEFVKSSGATKLSDVKVFSPDNPNIGVQIKDLSIWGMDDDALIARLNGTLDNEFTVAERIEMNDTSAFGLETVFAPFMDATNQMTADVLEDATGSDDISEEIKQTIDAYEFSIKHSIITDFAIHPWKVNLTPNPLLKYELEELEESTTELWHMLQKFGAYAHAHSYSDWASYDMTFKMDMTQNETGLKLDGTAELSAMKNYAQGDLEYGVVKNMAFAQDVSVDDAIGMTPSGIPPVLTMDVNYGHYSYKDMKLARAMDHLSRGIMPKRADTDFLSFGTSISKDLIVSFQDTPIYSIDKLESHMSLHWLIPKIVEVKMDNYRFNIGGILSMVDSMMEQTTTEEAADAREVMAKITPILDTHDINEISMDIHLAGKWNPDNGGSDFLFNYGIDGFSRFEFSTNNLLPSYEDLMTVLPEDLAEFDEDIFDETWAEVFGQGKLTATLIDEGGLERSFVIAKDFAQLVDHNDPPMGFLKSAKPDQVRQMVAGSVLMAAPEVEKNFPPAVAYLQAFSDYMSKGGTIRFIMDPGKVLTGDDFEAVVEKTGEDPEKIIKELGISVVHDLAE